MAAGETEVPAADDGGAAALVVRHRVHRFPGRRFEVKALFDDSEATAVRAAAALAGLTPSGYVAAAAVTAARPDRIAAVGSAVVVGVDRAVLAELLAARTAVRRYAVNVNQASCCCAPRAAGSRCGCGPRPRVATGRSSTSTWSPCAWPPTSPPAADPYPTSAALPPS